MNIWIGLDHVQAGSIYFTAIFGCLFDLSDNNVEKIQIICSKQVLGGQFVLRLKSGCLIQV